MTDTTDELSSKGSESQPYRLPKHGSCFICAPDSGSGIDITFYNTGDRIEAETSLDERHQGPPGHTHGGVLLAILDEAMGAAAWSQGHRVLAAHLEIDFKRPVPLEVPLTIEGRVASHEGKKVFTEGRVLLEDGAVAVISHGVFVSSPQFFKKFDFQSDLD